MAKKRQSQIALETAGYRVWKREFEPDTEGGKVIGFYADNPTLREASAPYAGEMFIWREIADNPSGRDRDTGEIRYLRGPNPLSEREAFHSFLDRVAESAGVRGEN